MGLGSCRLAHRSIRHECLDQIIVLDKRSLQRTLRSNYHKWPTHLALGTDTRDSRRTQGLAEEDYGDS